MTIPTSFKLSLLAMLLASAYTTANAQNTGAQATAEQQKRCEAVGGTSGSGNANKNDDMESTYSSCRLIDGYIGVDVRTNDGVGDTKGYSADEAAPDLRKPSRSGRTHSLGLIDDSGLNGENGGQAGKGLSGKNSANTIDEFNYAANEQQLPGWDGSHAPSLVHQGVSENNTQLLSSASSSGNGLPADGGVGGGGTGGGIDTGRNAVAIPVVPPIPAIPEPQTWAMLMGGLGILLYSARRRASRRA